MGLIFEKNETLNFEKCKKNKSKLNIKNGWGVSTNKTTSSSKPITVKKELNSASRAILKSLGYKLF